MSRRCRSIGIAIFLLADVALCGISRSAPEYEFFPVGLVGSAYSPGSNQSEEGNAFFNDSGLGAGDTNRYGPYAPDYAPSYGSDAWYFNGTSTEKIGYYGPGYSFIDPTTDDTYEASSARFIDSAGDVAGESARYSSASTYANKVSLGGDAWLFSGNALQQIGLTGAGYSYTDAGAGGQIYEESSIRRMNPSGQVLGWSNRYDSSGNSLGQDAWIYSGGGLQLIGLFGQGYSYSPSTGGVSQYNSPTNINDSGEAIGATERFDSGGNRLGADSWFYDGSTTTQIGLIGPDYSYTTSTGGTYRESQCFGFQNSGVVSGIVSRYSPAGASLGQDSGSLTDQRRFKRD